MVQDNSMRLQSWALLATGLGIIAFWGLFFTVGLAPVDPPPCYFAFEHSFPVPDLTLAVGLIASGVNILTKATWGGNVSLVCAGGLLFLGLIDLSFGLQNGGFTGPFLEALQSGLISAWCIILGIWIIMTRAGLLRPAFSG